MQAQGQDAWKRTMHKVAEHSESTYPSIYCDGENQISFDEVSTINRGGRALYTVRVGEDIHCDVSAEYVTRFLAAKGIDSSRFE